VAHPRTPFEHINEDQEIVQLRHARQQMAGSPLTWLLFARGGRVKGEHLYVTADAAQQRQQHQPFQASERMVGDHQQRSASRNPGEVRFRDLPPYAQLAKTCFEKTLCKRATRPNFIVASLELRQPKDSFRRAGHPPSRQPGHPTGGAPSESKRGRWLNRLQDRLAQRARERY